MAGMITSATVRPARTTPVASGCMCAGARTRRRTSS